MSLLQYCPCVMYQPQPETQHPWDMETNGKLWEVAPTCWWVQNSREGAGTDGHNINGDEVEWDGMRCTHYSALDWVLGSLCLPADPSTLPAPRGRKEAKVLL